LTGGEIGHLKRSNLPPLKYIREFRAKEIELKEGDKLDAAVFVVGEKVDVSGTSKGKGFAGAVKRYHFRGGPKTHGQSDRCVVLVPVVPQPTPGRVYKGTRGPGQYGQ